MLPVYSYTYVCYYRTSIPACCMVSTFNCVMLPYISTHVLCYRISIPTVAQLSALAPLQDFLVFLAWSSASASLQCTMLLQHLPLHAATYIHL